MTNDFLLKSYNPQLALERGQELIPRIRKLEEAFLSNGLPVIYTTDRHLKSDFELKKWGPHSMKGTKGSKTVEGQDWKATIFFICSASLRGGKRHLQWLHRQRWKANCSRFFAEKTRLWSWRSPLHNRASHQLLR